MVMVSQENLDSWQGVPNQMNWVLSVFISVAGIDLLAKLGKEQKSITHVEHSEPKLVLTNRI